MEILKLDYDNIGIKEIYNYFKTTGKWIIKFFNLKVENINAYKTSKGYHLYIVVNNKLTTQDIVFLQLALGSDFMRECFYWKRIKEDILKDRGWNILFKKKYYSLNSKKKPSIEDRKPYIEKKILKIINEIHI